MTTISLSARDFRTFRDFFYERTGIEFDEGKRYFVDARLLRRMSATGATSFADYFERLCAQDGGEELQAVINLMTVNETYFYREVHQFQCLVGPVLDEVIRTRGHRSRPIRILSLPCSTGEEPYSIALHLLENRPDLSRPDVALSGCDIDTAVLDRARAGVYGPRAVQRLAPEVRNRHFRPATGDCLQISDEIRSAVSFSRLNLADPAEARSLRDHDVIFCRNMLIYFDDASRRIAAEALFDALTPGGFLFLGHSETISTMSARFAQRRFPQGIVYQRPRA